jgi:nitrite reductase/ring-hydroxylating ferredoxin subunit
MKKIFLLFPCLILLFSGSCSKNDNQNTNPVPTPYVSFSINLDNPLYIDLTHQGGYDTLDNVGNKGIIIVHDYSDNYWAYDRTCPYHVNTACGKICMGSLNLVCGHYTGATFHPCCTSKYSLDGGVVTSGPSTYPLRRYNVAVSGNLLTVSN